MIITEGGHCWITFDNGYTLSMFNGYGSYTENHYKHKKMSDILDKKEKDRWESKEVEIAILNQEGSLITQDILNYVEDSVMTVNVKKLVKIINIVSKLGDTNVKD